jgi:hypothetical protein
MLDRIVMHRVDMPLSIQIIPDRMLPKSPLPDAPLALLASASANPLAAGYPTRAIRFDQAPTHRIIAVAFCKRLIQAIESLPICVPLCARSTMATSLG